MFKYLSRESKICPTSAAHPATASLLFRILQLARSHGRVCIKEWGKKASSPDGRGPW